MPCAGYPFGLAAYLAYAWTSSKDKAGERFLIRSNVPYNVYVASWAKMQGFVKVVSGTHNMTGLCNRSSVQS
jgi:hypothetical protein